MSEERSKLIDVTYQQLYLFLSGYESSATPEETASILQSRLEVLKNFRNPFGKPNAESKKKIESNTVTLRDAHVARVGPGDKPFVFAISSKFNIDEVEAFVLFRSYLYNEGIPQEIQRNGDDSFLQQVVDAFSVFYYSERRCLARLLVPLLRAKENEVMDFHTRAAEFLPQIIPDGPAFVQDIISEYHEQTHATVPPDLSGDPKGSTRWAKENLRNQLVLLEVTFWAMWSYVPRQGPLVVLLYERAYSSNLGSKQMNGNLLLDDESSRLQQDCAAIWLLIMLEVLELENFSDNGPPDISAEPSDTGLYTASPESLKKLHHLVISHGDGHFSMVFLAWTIILSRLEAAVAMLPECPPSYRDFFDSLDPQGPHSYSKGQDPFHTRMLQRCLDPNVKLFDLLLAMLTTTPVFVTSIAWRADSAITDPNSVAYRSVIKGLLIALSETIPVELVPDFDTFVEVWVALFGRSESQSVIGLCQQFWQYDFVKSPSRRAVVDVARSRFPVQFRPLLRILSALGGSGFKKSDPLISVDYRQADNALAEERAICAQHVSFFFDMLTTYTQVIPLSACTGAHALYEKVPERYGSSSKSSGPTYVNLRPIKLPGGSVLPPKSTGRLLSQDREDYIIVAWQHEHSGWRLVVEVLVDYVQRRRLLPRVSQYVASEPPANRRTTSQPPVTLQLDDIGVEFDADGDPHVVADALDLLCSVIKDNAALAAQVLDSVENNEDLQGGGAEPPHLVQLTMLVLEDALSRSAAQPRKPPPSHLITSAMNLLSGLLSLPGYAHHVWLFARASTSLFDTSRNGGSASAVLAAERALGSYFTTRALLDFVQSLFNEASASVLLPAPAKERLQELKEEVLLRALRFVHAEIWMEHTGWKYSQLGTRFEVGRVVSTLYGDILEHAPPTSTGPLSTISRAVFDALVSKATTPSIGPLIAVVTTYRAVLHRIYASRRLGDLKGLYLVLRSHLRVMRLCLTYKQRLHGDSGPCLLEQALCARAGTDGGSFNGGHYQADPLDVLSSFVGIANTSSEVPLEAIHVLYALCTSLATSQPSAPTIVGHLSDPEATVAALVRVAQHPYQEQDVRLSVWRFMAVSVEKEPALGHLFIAGQFRTTDSKVRDGAPSGSSDGKKKENTSALGAAREMIANWQSYWEINPMLLAGILEFLYAVWARGLEHETMIESIRKDGEFWALLAEVALQDLSPAPEYKSTEFIDEGGIVRSAFHDSISTHAYQTLSKAYATRIIALDIAMTQPTSTSKQKRPPSFECIAETFKSEDQLADLLHEAISNVYDPALYDEFTATAGAYFPDLVLSQYESRSLLGEREFGDDFEFAVGVLQIRMRPFHFFNPELASNADELVHTLFSINQNLSLAHASTELSQAWYTLLLKVAPFLQGDESSRPRLLALAATISSSLAEEKRSGDLISTVHGVRLSILLALLELIWFSSEETAEDTENFMKVVANVHDIITNEAQSPINSVRGASAAPFHRTLLQIIYFCIRQCRKLAARPKKSISADQRLTVTSAIDTALIFVIDSLRFVFDAARGGPDPDLDLDMELLVAVFEQCTQIDINPSTSLWLTRCQETSVLRASLELFVQADLTGLSTLALSRSRKQALYAPHILTFHIAFASIQLPAERLASEGVLVAYSNSSITAAVQSGSVDVTLPELPGERSPAHRAYCVMLSVVAGVISALGVQKHFFDAEASGFVQLFGSQIARTLAWTIGDALTLPFVEEMERVVGLFYAIASTAPPEGHRNPATETVLAAFTSNALLLLQQLNYALSHPNHLASLVEPVTAEERTQLEKDARGSSARSVAAEVVDPTTRPFLARLVHRLYGITSNIVQTLIIISAADSVLKGEAEDLPTRFALVVPHSKVVLGEPASMGTLLELASGALDVLGHLASRPAGQAITTPSPSDRALDVRAAVITARRTLETVLFYAATQLGTWLARPALLDSGTAAGDAEMDAEESRGALRRDSAALTERMRRGLTGEMASELKATLEKARGVLERCREVEGPGAGVDVTKVLIGFLNERVINAA
ncbi:hypothetical protein BV25DRAFT_1817355 [Artomyces pyxidatus]|uniref:Uncharacterized protein n=1 Tax=Artomyces pyxidatus TaxID=48021 RepID=A0ACB8TJE2_9AGAM|nr:hypothetical protein BV25DRAFT_1817355 [Artomyces pyxidatus]